VERVNEALHAFGAALSAIDAELDWKLLGRSYCEGDGSEFFDAALRERIQDTGMRLAEDIGRALGDAPGRSLYLGAEIAELPLILAEHLVLGRQVEWLNIECVQTSELARALGAVSTRLSVQLPVPRVRGLAEIEPASCDHLWMVSVLTDPDSFPALHDTLYERAGGPLATRRGSLADDRRRAEALVEALLERAALRCVLSTSDEERGVVEPLVARRGWTLEFARGGRLSAIVGDRVRIGSLTRARATPPFGT
jgi:hypothetical protein